MAEQDRGYFVPTNPSSGEEGTYNRRPTVEGCFWFKTRTFTWTWAFTSGYTPTRWPRVRALIDRQPATDWMQPTTNKYTFALRDVPNGNHLFGAEYHPDDAVPSEYLILAKGFLVNDTGAKLPNPGPVWITTTRFERLYNFIALTASPITYPAGAVGQLVPPTIALKAREAPSANGKLQRMADQWCVRTTHHSGAGFWRRWTTHPTGDLTIQPDNKYFYSEAVAHGIPHMTMRDGPRNFGTLGFVSKFIRSLAKTGWYYVETNGRVAFLSDQGAVLTIAGWRYKRDRLPLHAAYRESHAALWAENWELVGDFSRVPAPTPKQFTEIWGLDGYDTRAAGHGAGYHELSVCDFHGIFYVDHWTAHPPEHYHKALYPPVGYTPPDQPTGQSTVVLALGPSSGFVNDPWDITTVNGKKYWTNFGDGSICRANLDFSNPERVWWPAHYPTDEEIGVTARLNTARGELGKIATVRANYSRPGGPGVGNLVRPQGLDADSTGRYLLIASRYDFIVYELDLETWMLRPLTDELISQTNNDMSVSVDRLGWLGPVDSFYVGQWNAGTDRHYLRDGTRAKSPLGEGVANGRIFTANNPDALGAGPRNYLDDPTNYAWNAGVGEFLIQSGSGGGYQCLSRYNRLPTDVEPDRARYKRGRDAMRDSGMVLTHGLYGQGELGYRTLDELGGWTDAQIADYAKTWIPAPLMGDFVYFVRVITADNQYGAPPDPPKPPVTTEVLIPTDAELIQV
jgi:hypothetical protein